MNINDKIYVAGHRGLVGSAIMRKLKSEGFDNIIVRTSKELDLRRQSDVENFFQVEKPDYVFLAAAKVGGILANSTYKAEFIYDNLMIASNIISSAYKYNVKKLLNLGSSCIYPKNASQPMKEEFLLTGPLEQTNEPYAIAKIAAIKLCKYFNEQYGTNFISIMPTNLYGPGDNFDLETAHVLPSLLRKFHLAKLLKTGDKEGLMNDIEMRPLGFGIGKVSFDKVEMILKNIGITPDRVVLWGSGNPFREFMHVDDLVRACLMLIESKSISELGEFVNIGTGVDLRIKELANLVGKIIGFSGEIMFDDTRPDGTPKKLLDIERIKSLGWVSEIPLDNGIKKTYEWYIGG